MDQWWWQAQLASLPEANPVLLSGNFRQGKARRWLEAERVVLSGTFRQGKGRRWLEAERVLLTDTCRKSNLVL
jgi:hypothetical protein